MIPGERGFLHPNPPPMPCSVSSNHLPVCLSGQLVVRAKTFQASCPPALGSGDHYGRLHRRPLHASVWPGTVRACCVLTSQSGRACSWPGVIWLLSWSLSSPRPQEPLLVPSLHRLWRGTPSPEVYELLVQSLYFFGPLCHFLKDRNRAPCGGARP